MRVPLAVPDLNGRESEYLQECIRSTFVSTAGPFVTRFEEGVAAVSGTEDSAALCSGTVALQMALQAVGVGQGDLVMLPTLTFIASSNAVRHAGADVWLTDCSEADWTIDLDLVRSQIESETEPHPRGRLHVGSGKVLRALMPVMTMGESLDFDRIVEIGDHYNLKIVVDAAAAIGATTANGAPLGTTGVDAVCYSFNGNKTVTTGGGGAVTSADAELVRSIRHVSTTARVGPTYDHDVVGYNFRMTNVEAALGVAQLERLEKFLERKREVYERYVHLAESVEGLSGFPTGTNGGGVHWFSGVYWSGEDATVPGQFREFMTERGVDVRPFWKPIHMQAPYSDSIRSETPVAEKVWDRILPMPCSSGITAEELDYVTETAAEFWSARSAVGVAR